MSKGIDCSAKAQQAIEFLSLFTTHTSNLLKYVKNIEEENKRLKIQLSQEEVRANLMGYETIKRVAEKGEFILVINKNPCTRAMYSNGDILQVLEVTENTVQTLSNAVPHEEYVVMTKKS